MFESRVDGFVNELEVVFSDNAMKILLVLTALNLYPFISQFGFVIDSPILLVVNSDSERLALLHLLRGFDESDVLSTADLPKKIEKKIAEDHYGVKFWFWEQGRYLTQNMANICASSANSGKKIGDIFVNVIFASGTLQASWMDIMEGTVFMQKGKMERKSVSSIAFLREIITYAMAHVPEITYAIKEEEAICENEVAILRIAGKIIRLLFQWQDCRKYDLEKFDISINNALDDIEKEWKNANDPMSYVIRLREVLYKKSIQIENAFERRSVPDGEIKNIEKLLFYDKNNYYLSEALFCLMAESICDAGFGINYLKMQLSRADVLENEGKQRNYYTTKVDLLTKNGIVTKRLMCLKRENLDRLDGLSLVETIMVRKEKEKIAERKARKAFEKYMLHKYF